MLKLKRYIGSSVLVFVLAGAALAQESRAPVDIPQELKPAAPLVTAAATAKRVRFVSPGAVIQLRLEVYNEAGHKLFDTELHGGNVLDWHLQDGAGQRLQTGSYACVLTIKSLSGRFSQRLGVVTVDDKKAVIETAKEAQLSLAQQQTIGPMEGNAAFRLVQESEAEAITTITHDGTDGQMTSTKGALTFRTGDLFSGKDKEHMRITEDGKVGIGTDKPEATLDIAGSLRVSEGVRFSDGTTLDAASGKLTVRDAKGDPVNVGGTKAAGTGTANRVAKWTETGGAGTLGDSAITENGGNVVVGSGAQTGNIQIFGNANQDVFAGMGPDINAGPGFNYGYAGGSFGRSAGFFNVRPDVSAVAPNPSLRFMTANVERMIVTNLGNVGIGTTNPGVRLHVAGGDLLFENKWRTETTAYTPNLIGGFLGTGSGGATPGNRVTAGVVGATIAGGGHDGSIFLPSGGGFIGDVSNLVTDWFGTVGGGIGNRAGNSDATLDNAAFATVSGGNGNTASGLATVGGGLGNEARGTYSTVPGGLFNTAQGAFSFAAGNQAKANHTGAFVWADSNPFDFASTANNQFLIRATGGVGIGTTTTTDAGLVVQTPVGAYSLAVTDGTVKLKARITFGAPSTAEFGTTSNHDLVFVSGGFPAVTIDANSGSMFPAIDNNKYLGLSSKRWVAVYAVNGTIQTSDARLKKAVTNLDYGLSQVLQLRPVSFQWKGRNDGRTYLGLIAQEVEKIIPEAVERDKDPANPMGMNYTSLVPVLIKAVQEQQTAITEKAASVKALQTENAALKEQNVALEARVAAIEQMLQQMMGEKGQAQLSKRQQ